MINMAPCIGETCMLDLDLVIQVCDTSPPQVKQIKLDKNLLKTD